MNMSVHESRQNCEMAQIDIDGASGVVMHIDNQPSSFRYEDELTVNEIFNTRVEKATSEDGENVSVPVGVH